VFWQVCLLYLLHRAIKGQPMGEVIQDL
jgi:hypothetical protein